MTQAVAAAPPAIAPIPVREILPWAIFVTVLAAITLYFVGADNAAVTLLAEDYVHAFLHDGRHLMAFPCH